MEAPGASAPGYDRQIYGAVPAARSPSPPQGGAATVTNAFAGLGERVPDPVDMQRAMAPRSVPPGGDGLSPRLTGFGKGGTPRRMRYSFLSGQNTHFLSSDTMNDIAASHLRKDLGPAIGHEEEITAQGPADQGGEGAASPRRRADTREEYAFSRKWKKVELDLSPSSVKKSADMYRQRQSRADVRTVFRRIDMKNDGKVDAEEVEALLKGLGYDPEPEEVQDMIWEVDDDCDGVLNWQEFQSVYNRVRADQHGKEPRRMYTIIEFCLFDLDASGLVGLNEVMEMFYRRYGRIADLDRREMTGIITFKQFVKRDTAFYALSRQIEDSHKAIDANKRKKMLADLQEQGFTKEDGTRAIRRHQGWKGAPSAMTPRGAMSQSQIKTGLRRIKPPSTTGQIRSSTGRATRAEEQRKKAAKEARAAKEIAEIAEREAAQQGVRDCVTACGRCYRSLPAGLDAGLAQSSQRRIEPPCTGRG